MEVWAIILSLVGIVALLAHKRGQRDKDIERLNNEVESQKNRRDISDMSDDELDDELRKYWD